MLAESRAPFARSDSAVISYKNGHGIWWWDADRIAAAVEPQSRYRLEKVVPESLLQPVGHGLRQLELRDGFEAQAWREGALVLSSWRRTRFSAGQWSAFARAADPNFGAQDLEPPAPLSLPHANAGSSRLTRSVARDPWEQFGRAAGLAILFFLFAAAALAGRAIGYAGLADAETGAAASLAAPVVTTAQGESGLEASVAQQFIELHNTPSPIAAIAEIHQLLAKRNAPIIEFSVEKGRLEVQLQPPAETSLKAIASDVEASPIFAGVDPEFDNATGLGRIVAALCRPATTKEADLQCLRAQRTP